MKNYSQDFYSILSQKLLQYSKENIIARPTYELLKQKVQNGITLNIDDLNKNLIEILFIQELCSDKSVANLYGLTEQQVKNLRLLYSVTDEVIQLGHPLWIAHKLSSEIEDMLGENAYSI